MLRPATLVLGGTGKTGRRVAERLTARGVPTRIGSRSGAPPFDWDDRATWAPALRDMEAVYVSYFPDLAVPGAVGDGPLVRRAGRASAACGGSCCCPAAASRRPSGPSRRCATPAPSWTIVRSSWFSQNFSEGYLLDQVRSGEVALPAGDVRRAVRRRRRHRRRRGRGADRGRPRRPALRADRPAAADLRGRGRRDRRARPAARSATCRSRSRSTRPCCASRACRPRSSRCSTYLFTEVLDGRNARLADGVQRALGREPRDFADYARDAAAGGAWSPLSGERLMDGILFALTLAGALGCGLSAGAFYAFSSFVMQAWPPSGGPGARRHAGHQRHRGHVRLHARAVRDGRRGGRARGGRSRHWSEPYAPWLLAGAVLYRRARSA